MVRIIHISDFHLEEETASYQKTKIVDALVEDISHYVNEYTLLFFTGDLIDKGGKNFKSKENIFEVFERVFINPIVEKYPDLKEKIFIVPGNHDVIRDKIDEIVDSGLSTSLNSELLVNNFLKKHKGSQLYIERLSDYKKWETNFYKDYKHKFLSNYDNSFLYNIGSHKVGISCFNSSWLCKDDNDRERLIVGQKQIEDSLELLNDCDVKLALMHHPIEFLIDFDREAVKDKLYKNYDVLFTGHVHQLDSMYTQNLTGKLFISIAGSTIADNPTERKYANGYSVISLNPKKGVEVIYRKYLENHEKFVSNTDVGTDDGRKNFTLMSSEILSEYEKVSSIVSHIESQHSERLNDHIIISSESTSIQCSVDNLFVEPKILNCIENTLREDQVISYSVDSIISSKTNFLIYGPSESGKTILLDKIFLESIKKYNTLRKIPVLIKFSEFINKEPLRVIREFIGVKPQDISNFINENNLLLIIDDLSFAEKNSKQLENIKLLLSAYPRIQVIASGNQTIENIMPVDYLKHNNVFSFDIGFIQSLGSKQIKQFIQKWFVGKDVDLQNNMEKLLKSFSDFGLPKTPLSVTLFLWIFEKQEKRPINNSVLVEMFVENILEKTKIDNIYSETFDFKNKQRLLSFVAKFMHDNGDSLMNYCVDYVQTLDFISNYLRSRFPGQPQKILDDFIVRGIFSYEEGNLLRFKSAFFFHYFLAIHMDYSLEFKEYIFSDENYLNYVDEINYYTGLKRDDTGILDFTLQKLDNAFSEFNIDISENYERVDRVLEVKSNNKTVAFNLQEDNARIKPSEEQLDAIYDDQLSSIPVQKAINRKQANLYKTAVHTDRVLKLASLVLKNSEDVDDFDVKLQAYEKVLLSSISFLMAYRDNQIDYYLEFRETPQNLPKNIDFSLLIKIMPLMHQVIMYDWLGSPKLRPVIIQKMQNDKLKLNISEYEKFLSVYMYADIKGTDYPKVIENFVKSSANKYIKDLSYLKIMSYYHLRSKDPELDEFYLKLMSEIKADLGQIPQRGKGIHRQQIKKLKRRPGK